MLKAGTTPITAIPGIFNDPKSGILRFLLLFVMHVSVQSCGPVRSPRMSVTARLRPLFYNEHFPRIPETSFAASGPPEGRITRQDPRFKLLEPNYNEDIIFRDRGNPDAYLMTKRLQERINNLAISVANQWPGVKLTVRKGWSEMEDDGPNSLHYEGRAVDVLTSDKNKSHMGLLARLAVEAKFDWVHYEKKGYIHCSVKSENTQSKSAGCFTGDSFVRTRNGPKPLSKVQLGEELLTMNPETGSLEYSPLMLFLDRQPETKHLYVHIKTSSGQKIKLTPSHLIMRWEKTHTDLSNFTLPFAYNAVPTFAKNINVNDKLIINRNNRIHLDSVESVTYSSEIGMYAPLTEVGNVLVNDIVASCYAVIDDQDLAHLAFLPYRFVYNINRSFNRFYKTVSGLVAPKSGSIISRTHPTPSQQGIHWYAKFLYSIAYYIIPPSMMYEH